MKTKMIKADRPAVWARFACEDERDGTPYTYKSRLVFWQEDEDGKRVGVIIGTKNGQLTSAESFPNFRGYEYGRGAELVTY